MKDPNLDQDAERLRALLTAATPSGPDDPDRASRVAARGRRDRRRVIIASVIGAVAAAVIIAPQVLNATRTSDVGENVTNRPTATQQEQGAAAMSTTPCPQDPLEVPDTLTDQTIPEGAVSLRLCPAAFADGSVPAIWVPPADALLTEGVADFMNTVAKEAEVKPDRCAAIRPVPDPYVLLVGMPDGSVEQGLLVELLQ